MYEQADKDGTCTTVIPEGILVQASSDGRISSLVSRIDDRTALGTNRDGITGFEDIETIVGTSSLLANDTLGGFAGSNLTKSDCYEFSSWSRPVLLGCRPKTLPEMASNEVNFMKTA